ncbi:MAG: lysylphosphatidylglycerol synthase transmembrane domain-containing protein [Pleurocapsa sp.]
MIAKKNILYAVLSCGLGIFLVWLILTLTPVTIEQIVDSLKNLSLFYVVLVVITTFVHLWITSYKWQLIAQKLTDNHHTSQKFYLYYIVFANLIAQFVPYQVGLTIVQGLAIKLHKVGTLSQGFFSLLYDQFFNLLIPILLLPPTLLLFLNKVSLSWAIFLVLGILLATHIIIVYWHKPLAINLFKYYRYFKQKVRKKNAPVNLEATEEIPVLSTRFTLKVFWISVIRHANWILRSFFVVLAGKFAIGFWAIAFTINLVQTAMIISVTPANLGFMEWSWIGGLELLGIPAAIASNFAVVQRILGVFAVIIIALGCWLGFGLDRLYFKKNEISQKKY